MNATPCVGSLRLCIHAAMALCLECLCPQMSLSVYLYLRYMKASVCCCLSDQESVRLSIRPYASVSVCVYVCSSVHLCASPSACLCVSMDGCVHAKIFSAKKLGQEVETTNTTCIVASIKWPLLKFLAKSYPSQHHHIPAASNTRCCKWNEIAARLLKPLFNLTLSVFEMLWLYLIKVLHSIAAAFGTFRGDTWNASEAGELQRCQCKVGHLGGIAWKIPVVKLLTMYSFHNS